ncbi:MAG: SDR family oxidoreductase [Rhodothermaceae bacterium]|nr:SDR family oxidoreductase [Rhodothermaceae bacterium]
MFDLSDQTVLMIGELSDLAAGVAAVFKEAGAEILVVYNSTSDPNLLRLYPDGTYLETSLYDPIELASTLANYTFQTVVISPGWFQHRSFLDSNASDIENAYRINFEHAIYSAQSAAKRLIEQGEGGVILFLSSVVSKMPTVETNLVGSSLASLEVIATMAAVDLAQYGIRVNVVAAGWLENSWAEPLLGVEGRMKEPTDIPLGKVGSTKSVGQACCFLASPMAEYITGVVLPVDGGFTLTKSLAQSPYRGTRQ